MAASGDPFEQVQAKKVLRLLKRGYSLLSVIPNSGNIGYYVHYSSGISRLNCFKSSNVVVNETLPIVFDSVLGGGWPAIALSTTLIVIFGEVIPQAACVRYGLPIGARCSRYSPH